jgi:hypothetical protein
VVVLPYTGASRYHNCCIDGVTSPEYFGYTLAYITDISDSKIFCNCIFIIMTAVYTMQFNELKWRRSAAE